MGLKKNRAKPSASKGKTSVGVWLPAGSKHGRIVPVVSVPTTLRGAFRELFRAFRRFWRYLWGKDVVEPGLTLDEQAEIHRLMNDIFNNKLRNDIHGKK